MKSDRSAAAPKASSSSRRLERAPMPSGHRAGTASFHWPNEQCEKLVGTREPRSSASPLGKFLAEGFDRQQTGSPAPRRSTRSRHESDMGALRESEWPGQTTRMVRLTGRIALEAT